MNGMMGTSMGVAMGFLSALVPVVNAEAYAVSSGLVQAPWVLIPIAIALAFGQTAGKLVLFEAARRGSTRFKAGPKLTALSTGRWALRIQRALQQPRSTSTMVLVSAGLGLPPLAIVAVAAGAVGHSRPRFAALCFAGRTARFTALVIPTALALARN